MLYHTENPHGGDCYAAPVRLDFSANTNPLGTPEGVCDAVRESLSRVHLYPDPSCRALVAAIAEHEQVPRSRILCGSGAAELIYAFCQAVKPQKALELAPTFSEYSRAVEQFGGRMCRVLLHRENDFLVGEELLEALERERPDAVFLCNPNNPTGRLIPGEILEQVLLWTAAHHTPLLLDECFLDLTEEGCSAVSRLAEFPQVFLLKAFTKSYGMAGLRLGYGLSADESLLEAMSRFSPPWNVSTPAQAAGIAALGEREFLARTLELIREQRQWLCTELTKLGFRVCPSQVNFLLFEGPEDLAVRLREQGIAIRSCANFEQLGSGWFRIAVRRLEENQELIRAIRGIERG